MIKKGLRILGIALGVCLFSMISGIGTLPVWAMTPIKLSNISYHECSAEMSEGAVTSAGFMAANCFIITGKASNPSKKTVYDADVYGLIYDANNNSVLPNRSRVGSIDVVPPGDSNFEVRISVAANQPTPLKLEKFKASGFAGKVSPHLPGYEEN
jgi:hypothetical protein